MQARLPRFEVFSEPVWTDLTAALARQGANWDGSAVRIAHGPFVVTLDLHAELAGHASHCTTRLRAAFRNADGFRFRVERQGLLTTLATWLGAEDLEIGDTEFDRAFRLHGNQPAELRRLLADPALRSQLLASRIERIEIQDDEGWFGPEFPEGVDELRLELEERVIDLVALQFHYRLFARLLDRLCAIGSAYEDDPQLTL